MDEPSAITASIFIKKFFIETEGIIEITDYKIGNELVVLKDEYHSLGVRFKNCEFLDIVSFEGVNLKEGLFFHNCTFRKSLKLINCQSSFSASRNIKISTPNSEKGSIYFNNCTIIDTLEIKETHLSIGLTIENECNLNIVDINTVTVEGTPNKRGELFGFFDFVKSNILKNLTLKNINSAGSFRLNNTILHDGLYFSEIMCDSMFFTQTESKGMSLFAECQFNSGFFLEQSIFANNVKFSRIKFNTQLNLRATEFKTSCYLDLGWYNEGSPANIGKLNSLIISECSFGGSFDIVGTEKDKYICEISEINIRCSGLLKGQILLKNFFINSTKISGINTATNLIFDSINFHKLEIDNFSNFNKFQLLNCSSSLKKGNELSIVRSSLGGTQLFNVHLNNFEKISINDSILSEIVVSNVHWFKLNQLNITETSNRLDIISKRKKELFRQLKNALEKQGDRLQSLIFQQYEMQAFKEELYYSKNNDKNWINTIKTWFNGDWLIMWSSQSNDYGHNWLKPLTCLLILTAIFYLLIVSSAYSKSFTYDCIYDNAHVALKLYWIHKPSYFQMLNPTYLFDKVFYKGNYNTIAAFFDTVHRIFLAYFLFQLVSAFRKFIK